MTFTQSIATCFKKYATFKGRASRSEFWWFQLFQFLASFAIVIVAVVIYAISQDMLLNLALQLVSWLFQLAIFLPEIAVTCRRLHDTERSGWWMILPTGTYFIGIIFVGISLLLTNDVTFFAVVTLIATLGASICVLIWLIDPSDRGENKYGPSPFFDEETELDATTEETDIQSNN